MLAVKQANRQRNTIVKDANRQRNTIVKDANSQGTTDSMSHCKSLPTVTPSVSCPQNVVRHSRVRGEFGWVSFLASCFLYKTNPDPTKNCLLWEKVAQMPFLT